MLTLKRRGFTLIELLVVMAIISIIAAYLTVNLLTVQYRASSNTTIIQLISDLKGQQLKSLAGDVPSGIASSPHGVFFESNRYILFQGDPYNPNDPANFPVSIGGVLSLSNAFPGATLIFQRVSGQVKNYTAGSNTITIQNTATGERKTLTLNKYGTVVSVN